MNKDHFELLVERTVKSAMQMHTSLQIARVRHGRGEISNRVYQQQRDHAKDMMRVAVRAALNERGRYGPLS